MLLYLCYLHCNYSVKDIAFEPLFPKTVAYCICFLSCLIVIIYYSRSEEERTPKFCDELL